MRQPHPALFSSPALIEFIFPPHSSSPFRSFVRQAGCINPSSYQPLSGLSMQSDQSRVNAGDSSTAQHIVIGLECYHLYISSCSYRVVLNCTILNLRLPTKVDMIFSHQMVEIACSGGYRGLRNAALQCRLMTLEGRMINIRLPSGCSYY